MGFRDFIARLFNKDVNGQTLRFNPDQGLKEVFHDGSHTINNICYPPTMSYKRASWIMTRLFGRYIDGGALGKPLFELSRKVGMAQSMLWMENTTVEQITQGLKTEEEIFFMGRLSTQVKNNIREVLQACYDAAQPDAPQRFNLMRTVPHSRFNLLAFKDRSSIMAEMGRLYNEINRANALKELKKATQNSGVQFLPLSDLSALFGQNPETKYKNFVKRMYHDPTEPSKEKDQDEAHPDADAETDS